MRVLTFKTEPKFYRVNAHPMPIAHSDEVFGSGHSQVGADFSVGNNDEGLLLGRLQAKFPGLDVVDGTSGQAFFVDIG